MSKDHPFDDFLIPWLKEPDAATAYLNAALEDEEPKVFLMALYDVARANGFQATAAKADVHRVSLNKMLSDKGNPEWLSLFKVLAAANFRFRVEPVAASR